MHPSIAIAHLQLRLKPIQRLLRAAANRIGRAGEQSAGLARAESLLPDEVEALLEQAEKSEAWSDPALGALRPEEEQRERALREEAGGRALPLSALQGRLSLSEFEIQALLLCAAPEVDRAYERLYAYVLDDLNRRAPCVELLCSLSAKDALERHARREELAVHSRLVRCRLIRLGPEVGCEWRREVRLAPEALDWLLFARGSAESFRDPAEVPTGSASRRTWLGVAPGQMEQAAAALRGSAGATVFIHGARQTSQFELPRELARLAGIPLRTLPPGAALDPSAVVDAARIAKRLGAALWIPLATSGSERTTEERLSGVLEEAAACGASFILSGVRPMRSLRMMSERPWIELALRAPALDEVAALWSELVPELGERDREEVALAFRLSPSEMEAAANVYRSAGSAGGACSVDALRQACRTVARRQTHRLATVLSPSRTARDLVLPEQVLASVLDVARFSSTWARVAEKWKMAAMHRGARGVRAMFTGPSGTGKTLAAEVIAGILGQDLHKVDLAQLVSKWVGETEKNLDAAFEEAEQSQAVLFFDEADALFSKRGEVRHGTDRYANLEVSYLLQRLEDYAGLVIVATNLKENMDEAFTRRFHISVDFQRPAEEERRKLWALAFPASLPTEGVDVSALARLDMTGATIMNAARTAALLAACDGQVVRPHHLVEAIAREYRRESRLLLPKDLGAWGMRRT
jgi:hypothetical protein